MKPTFGSLFAGIGGLDLGLERAGWECRWQVEIDPYCVEVLKKHWPEVKRYGDIRTVTNAESVDLICGGFPCQPVSVAGRRKGQEDTRWLWPEFSRVIGMVRPRWVLVENVPGFRTANGGAAFAEVLQDLARHGYDAEWASIPAAAVGAPHLRYRVFLVAYPAGTQRDAGTEDIRELLANHERSRESDHAHRSSTDVADACLTGLEVRPSVEGDTRTERPTAERDGGLVPNTESQQDRRLQPVGFSPNAGAGGKRTNVPDTGTERWDGRSWVFGSGWRGELTNPSWWAVEPDVGRVAHGVPARVDRLRALGNAVVPQVAEWVGRRMIEVYHRQG